MTANEWPFLPSARELGFREGHQAFGDFSTHGTILTGCRVGTELDAELVRNLILHLFERALRLGSHILVSVRQLDHPPCDGLSCTTSMVSFVANLILVLTQGSMIWKICGRIGGCQVVDQRRIYLDNAADTALNPEVRLEMEPYLLEFEGNASSVHHFGRMARRAVDQARRELALLIGANESSVFFTSGGTESNHALLFGAYLARSDEGFAQSPSQGGESANPLGHPKRRHIVATAVEHPCVLETCSWLEKLGATVTLVPPDFEGRVKVESVLDAIRDDTAIVAMMAVNNEIGTMLPVMETAASVKREFPGIHVHSDMVQAMGVTQMRLKDSALDSAAFSAHKIHGPQGVGAAYLREDALWVPVLPGGAQERGKRAGTENVAGIVGFGSAARRLRMGFEERKEHLRTLRDRLWWHLSAIDGVHRNTPMSEAADSILNVSFRGFKSHQLLARLDLEGIAASAGAACSAGSLTPSHVLIACGRTVEEAQQSIRFSVGERNTAEEIDEAARIIRGVLSTLRKEG